MLGCVCLFRALTRIHPSSTSQREEYRIAADCQRPLFFNLHFFYLFVLIIYKTGRSHGRRVLTFVAVQVPPLPISTPSPFPLVLDSPSSIKGKGKRNFKRIEPLPFYRLLQLHSTLPPYHPTTPNFFLHYSTPFCIHNES